MSSVKQVNAMYSKKLEFETIRSYLLIKNEAAQPLSSTKVALSP